MARKWFYQIICLIFQSMVSSRNVSRGYQGVLTILEYLILYDQLTCSKNCLCEGNDMHPWLQVFESTCTRGEHLQIYIQVVYIVECEQSGHPVVVSAVRESQPISLQTWLILWNCNVGTFSGQCVVLSWQFSVGYLDMHSATNLPPNGCSNYYSWKGGNQVKY